VALIKIACLLVVPEVSRLQNHYRCTSCTAISQPVYWLIHYLLCQRGIDYRIQVGRPRTQGSMSGKTRPVIRLAKPVQCLTSAPSSGGKVVGAWRWPTHFHLAPGLKVHGVKPPHLHNAQLGRGIITFYTNSHCFSFLSVLHTDLSSIKRLALLLTCFWARYFSGIFSIHFRGAFAVSG
jgi:hypothetical protein